MPRSASLNKLMEPSKGTKFKIEPWMLKQRQSLTLDMKVEWTRRRIREWYYHYSGEVYVSFSGGKDSTVCLGIARQEFPDIPAVFFNTGLEFPEIIEFVKSIDNVVWLKPKMTFKQTIEKYGWPVIGKQVAGSIYRFRVTKDKELARYRIGDRETHPLSGRVKGMDVIPIRWRELARGNAFKISNKCCQVMKVDPAMRYGRDTGRHPMLATMAMESNIRKINYMKHGCNAFKLKMPISQPMAIWNTEDVWEYIRGNGVAYSSIYDMGYKHTGCAFCGFGLHREKGLNRFQLMAKTHPKLHRYCMYKLGLGKVLDIMEMKWKVE